MTKKLRFAFIAVLAALFAVCFVSGCKLNDTLDDIIKDNDLQSRITYLAGEGTFSDNKTSVKTLYFKPGNLPLDIGEPDSGGSEGDTSFVGGGFNVSLAKHNLSGWYRVKVNAEGKPLYTDGSVIDVSAALETGKEPDVYEEKFSFKTPLQKDDDIYLYAKWAADVRLRVALVTEEGVTATYNGNEYKNGDIFFEYNFYGDTATLERSGIELGGASFMSYYYDSGCTLPIENMTVQKGESDITVYAKYMGNKDGKPWKFVYYASDVESMFSFMAAENNYYIMNDIDCTDITVSNLATLSFTIEGNGHEISNLTVQNNTLRNGSKAALFGNVLSSAYVNDIKFENLNCVYRVGANMEADVNFVFVACEEGATFTDVTVGGSMKVTLANNARVGHNGDNLLYGGYAEGQECDGITATVDYTQN